MPRFQADSIRSRAIASTLGQPPNRPGHPPYRRSLIFILSLYAGRTEAYSLFKGYYGIYKEVLGMRDLQMDSLPQFMRGC